METVKRSLPFRDDTFLGVCEALGEDLGFNAQYLRMAFAVPLIFSPMLSIYAYLAAGALVLLSRLVFPNKPWHAWKAAPVEAAPAAPMLEAPRELALAA